jgi:KUP system potassium uptake protein
LTVHQTSEREGGQIYLPAVNALLFVGVLAVMLTFGSSQALATAYGVSVTGALVVDTGLLLLVAPLLWHWRPWQIVLAGIAFGGLEVTFLAANLSKVIHGGWVPVLIAVTVLTVMTTWRRGRNLVMRNRREKEGPLSDFVERVRKERVPRVPGVAVFPHPNKDTTPLALRATVDHNHVLHREVLVVSVHTLKVPHVPLSEAFSYDDLGYADDGIHHLSIKTGFSDDFDMPQALRAARDMGIFELQHVENAPVSYFLSRGAIGATHAPGMAMWRKKLFVFLSHNAANPAARFDLPPERTITMGNDIQI